MLLILALRRQRQEDLCEFEARTAKAIQRKPVSKNQAYGLEK